MQRRLERGLLVTALAIGLAGSVLVAVAGGATVESGMVRQPGLTLALLVRVWLQIALATFACHALLVRRARGTDQLLLPLSIGLTGLGLTVIFSLQPSQAQAQMNWVWLSLAVLLAVLHLPRRLDSLRGLRFTFGALTAVLLLLPMFFGRMSGGARLWLDIGPFSVQPGELAKLTLVLFLAGYLELRGELLATAGRRVWGLALPDPRYLGPLVVMWAVAMVLLVGLRELGTALLFFGTFVAMLYAATAQAGYVAVGGVGFLAGAYLAMQLFGHVRRRIDIWLNPWRDLDDAGYQVAQALFTLAAGGVSGTGLGLGAVARQAVKLPAATTDLPFVTVSEELGLWGAAVLVALFALWVYRALRVAIAQPDHYRALLATGLGCLMATQTLVILAGVTKLMPLTGITLPFISYGGSSLLTSYLMLGLLLRCSEPREEGA